LKAHSKYHMQICLFIKFLSLKTRPITQRGFCLNLQLVKGKGNYAQACIHPQAMKCTISYTIKRQHLMTVLYAFMNT
jgi:hypothetical protein